MNLGYFVCKFKMIDLKCKHCITETVEENITQLLLL